LPDKLLVEFGANHEPVPRGFRFRWCGGNAVADQTGLVALGDYSDAEQEHDEFSSCIGAAAVNVVAGPGFD
jgi:hypothetical protein